MTIKILSNTTINRIAAGEVIERPASAIKELVENSIDAGAKKIDIIIENAGRNLITIIDDGVGMNKADLELSIERHATSKLLEEDISKIDFFGFRGEALSSIASVSRTTITSKLSNTPDELAWSLIVNGGKKEELLPSSLSKGTKIEVRDLFFSTPARLKFLKTEKTETHYINDNIYKIAMANPSIGFSLTNNGKETINLKSHDKEEALYHRLNEIAGKGFKENFTYIEFNDPDCKIHGYISAPTYNTGTSSDQFFFVNKRPVKDKLLSMAVKIAYQDFIPNGRYPIIYLFLELDSSLVDVNVHPAKAEVRFKDTNQVRGSVISAIKEGIRKIGKQASNHLSDLAIESFSTGEVIKTEDVSIEEKTSPQYIAPFYRPSFSQPTDKAKNIASHMFAPITPVVKASPEEFDDKHINFPLGAACGQIHNTYIISQTEDGMILIDQHAAHERIFYERLKKQIMDNKIQTQRLFIPEIIELPEHVVEELLSMQEDFTKFGLYFETFGNGSISITELPALLRCIDVKKLIMDIVDDLKEYDQQVSLEKKINHFLATFACHHSIRAGRSLSIKEMNDLLREMEIHDHTGQCNHGRPTYIKLHIKDIEKLFERS